MESGERSPEKVESLEVHIIIHSLKINSNSSKYQVQVMCDKKNVKQETIKTKKNPDSDVVFFESTFFFHIKIFDKDTRIRFLVLEYIEGDTKYNGKASIKCEKILEKPSEFLDLKLKKCTDESGIICVSISSMKKMIPSISISENTADESMFRDTLEENITDSDDLTSEEFKNEDEEQKQADLPENEEKKILVEPTCDLKNAMPNSNSKSHSLEQSENKSNVGAGNKKCYCVCRLF